MLTVYHPAMLHVERLVDGPIVHPTMSAALGPNSNGPSLIRVPEWVDRPLGRYYLYFAHHQGEHVRLAYADDLTGPWRIDQPGTRQPGQTPFRQHIASPDVHVDEANRQIVMYYHGCYRPDESITDALRGP
ncbi:MAG: hypothetical protein GVY28_09615 [Alphaproteobacteria bacterium]|jgi:hypothetical protein|nr:hypothetical protein [Alphaproteobacteria bacterium]